jgi:hypothetical protein
MTKAAEVLQKIINGEKFDSEYTKTPDPDSFSIMKVDSKRLFEDLTDSEKFEFAEDIGNGWFHLNVWEKIWYWIPHFSTWVLIANGNMWDSRFSYEPDYIPWETNGESYIIDTNETKVFKEVV